MPKLTIDVPDGITQDQVKNAVALYTEPFHIEGRNAKKTYEITLADLHENGQRYVVDYGLNRGINDKIGAAELKDEPEKAAAIADKILQAWKDGTVRRSGGRVTDPVEKEIRRLAENNVRALIEPELQRTGTKWADVDLPAIIDEYLKNGGRDEVKNEAEANVEKAAKLAEKAAKGGMNLAIKKREPKKNRKNKAVKAAE